MDLCPTCKHVWLDRGELKAIEQDSLLALIRDFLNPGPDSAS
jgi:Zn-finger nucleic acid-binding protein